MLGKGQRVMQYGVLAVVLCVLCAPPLLAEDFDPKRTLLMDYYPRSSPRNFMFRGNMPKVNNSFAYKDLVASMSAVAKEHALTLPKNFTLIDISYLNIFEELDLKIEEDFFKANPHLGWFHNRVIIGTIVAPPQDDPSIVKDLVKEYVELSFDKLPGVMEYLHDRLVGPGPAVIFTHCEAGTDRTGEVSGAYYMRYLNMTFSSALYIDDHVSGRDIYTSSRNALQWYCFYLHFVQNYTQLECLV